MDLTKLSNDELIALASSLIPERRQTERAPNPAQDFGGLPLRPFGVDTGVTLPQDLSQSLAGAGKAMTDLARGAKQFLGFGSSPDLSSLISGQTQASRDAAEVNKRDAPLMATRPGLAGNIVGNVATALPTALIPGVNTYAGAAATSGIYGVLQPSEEGRAGQLKSGGMGALLGPAAVLGGRGAVALGKGGMALAEPFYERGRQAIAGRTLERFADNPATARASALGAQELVPGSRPTLAEATLDPGLAQLQRAAQSADPTLSSALANRGLDQNAARFAALRGVAGSPDELTAAMRARSAQGGVNYGPALEGTLKPDATLNELFKRPSMKQAAAVAQKLAAEDGISLQVGRDIPAHLVETGVLDASGKAIAREVPAQAAELSMRGLHYLKLGLDDILENPAANGLGKTQARSITNTKNAFLGWLDTAKPEYAAARNAFAQSSGPINRMQTGQELLKRGTGSVEDARGNPQLFASRFGNAMKNADALAQNATGFDRATMAGVMGPQNMQTIGAINKDLARSSAVNGLGKSVGSNTAQNLASQNIMRQLFGPLGMPQSFGESALLRTMARPVQYAFQAAEPSVQATLANALLDPKIAAAFMLRQQPSSMGMLAGEAERYLPALSAGMLPFYPK